MERLLKKIRGKKTYTTALGLGLYALYLLVVGGEPTFENPTGGPDPIQLLLEAAGLGSLRAGVKSSVRLDDGKE